ncbi:unnamed protein product, partial [Phaedon cochleariae]
DDGSCDSGDLQDGNVALSDVIEVIATDPDFRQRTETKNPEMFNGGGEIPVPQPIKSSIQARKQAYVKIVEQPASKALRFRYECEGRSAGSIPGARSTPETKTYPTVQIVGYQGRAVVVVSCVTKDAPHKPHPYKLVSKSNNKDCRDGIFQTEVNVKGPFHLVDLKNVGIQCVKRRRMANSLKLREELKIDPFNTGFSHRNQPTSIDLNTVRLCFQVFLEGDTPRKFSVPLTPVVSEPIYDKKAMSDLSITKLSDCVSYVDGGRKDMILLCEKVAKEDIQVRFFEDPGDWEAYADFQPSQVHKQHAIWFRTPRYKTLDVTEPVKVFIQLKRPSDGAVSEPLPFELWPLDSDPGANKRKRQKMENPEQIIRNLQGPNIAGPSQFVGASFTINQIKSEPRGSPSPYGGSVSSYGGVSPMYNIAASPQSQTMWESPSPVMMGAPGATGQPNQQFWLNIPVVPPTVNLPAVPPVAPATDLMEQSNNEIFNLDSGEIEKFVHRAYDLQDIQDPLPNLDNMSLSDMNINSEMTDSLTNFTNRAAEACGLMDVNKLS